MELLFNLLWLCLSFALFGFWLARRGHWATRSRRTSTGMQIVALAILIVILLPVVSLTDDLQACTTPAEVEHLIRRCDLHASGQFHVVSIAAANLFSAPATSGLQVLNFLSPPTRIETPSGEYQRTVGIRPPPAA